MSNQTGKYNTGAARWAGVGPYYAMFPSIFANAVITRYTNPGDTVLDPFAGRGTALFSAAINKRRGIGIEINPVGWVYSQTKLHPARQPSVACRFREISRTAYRYRKSAVKLPEFFQECYHSRVLEFLVAARDKLDWRRSRIDCTAMAFLLINLHGKRDGSLSNQMRQTKSMSPNYAVRWWRAYGEGPPKVDPLEFLLKRLKWRYAKGLPSVTGSRAYLGDSSRILPQIQRYLGDNYKQARLLLTSPPYYGITDYYYDQWLRLWLLGGPPSPKRTGQLHKGKFEDRRVYRKLLSDVFSRAEKLLAPDAVIYVRTDKRESTLTVTLDVLREVFPDHRIHTKGRPYHRPTQTQLFGHGEPGIGEIDLVLKI